MSSSPPGLLVLLQILLSLLLVWEGVRGESSYIIDTLGLTILPETKVQSGTKVTIRCQVRVSLSNISQLEHLFKILRDDIEIHTANTTEDSVDYEINPARVSDSGNYQCQVLVKDKRKASNIKRLDIRGLQTPILHLNNSNPYESEEFKVTCSAPEEKGGFIFNFYQKFKDGQPMRIKQLRSKNNFLETTMTLRHRGDCFLSCDYEISFVTGTKYSNISDWIPVKVKELSIIPHMTITPNDIYEPDIVEVICKVQSSLENIEIFLIKDRTVLKRATGKHLIYRFRPKATDSGELVCKVEWRNVQRENYTTLTVKEVFSKPRFTLEPVDLFEGETFNLSCSVDFFIPGMIDPRTFKYVLYKDGIELTKAATYQTTARYEHNGNYTCKVGGTRNASTINKESQTISVKAKVPVSDPVLSVAGGKMFLGKRFQLICHSHTGTIPIKYTLYGPNRLILNREVSGSEEQAIFDVPPISKTSDLETFLCHAKNNPRFPAKIALGQQLLKSTIIIEPVSKPELTILPSYDVTEGQSINLVCSVQTGSPPFNFTWYHLESPGALFSLASNKLKVSHSIQNANAKHVGRYYCTSTNPANEIKTSELVTIGVKLAGWKKVLIIIACLLLLLTFALVIVLRTRLLRFKRKSKGSLSVKSAGTKVERLSLTQAEVIDAANVTPSLMGKSLWSDHVSGSESDDQDSGKAPQLAEPKNTESEKRESDPIKVKQATDTIDSEVGDSQQGVPEVADNKPVKLSDDSNHKPEDSQVGDQSPNSENITETDNSSDVQTSDQEKGSCDPSPDC
ncbi:platelet endothelial cell adhesion molecule [Cyprinodon tularosa]|uniref:platelet endothelial cell adhesion molecule n=1 Tax=Cyprinodon tularosa TaxID=77115 RepID=UPI0018E25FDF|nr:platelet endothelial cell adhesion molecule [Cyprinodon tularosa]